VQGSVANPEGSWEKQFVGHISKSSFWETEDGLERFPEVHLFSISRAAFG